MKRLLVITFLCFLCKYKALAGDPNIVRYLGIEQGLSNNAVTCIYQDHNGFMWFGTYDGLNKYDGYSFKVFRNIIGNNASLVDNHVYCLDGDLNNNVWIGCEKGISVYNPVRSIFYSPQFKKAHSSSFNQIHDGVHIIRQVKNAIFTGTQANGLIVFENGELNGNQITVDGLKDAQQNCSVTAIEYDSVQQSVWVFVEGVGLCKYNFSGKNLVIVNSSIKQSNCIKKIKNSNILLVGNDNGLFSFNSSSGVYSNNLLPLKTRVTKIIEDRQNVCWIASDGDGVWLMQENRQPVQFSTSGNGINSNAVYDIYEDADGRKWIGALRGGVNIVEPKSTSFKKISFNNTGQDEVINDFILSFCEDEKQNVWIGTDGAGLRYWDRAANLFLKFTHTGNASSLSGNFITGITRDDENEIWISTWFNGINRYIKSTHTFKHYSCFNPQTHQNENNVWFTYEDRQKRLWASATNNGCLYIFNRSFDRFEIFDSSIFNFQSMTEDSAGNLWAGNYSLLVRLDVANKHHKIYNIGYTVRSIHEDKKHNFWIGTEGGGLLLFNRKNGTYERITTQDGLPGNTILKILEDTQGNLWLSTYNGLCRFNFASKSFRNFSQSDGLQSNQFSFNAALALKSGEFLFGGIKGFNIFYPDSIYNRKNIPPLFLTGLRIDNVPVEEDDNYVSERSIDKITAIKLPFDKAVLSLDFIALEYSSVDKLKYAYYLQGWDKNWNMVNNIRTANYSRLQEGNYIFYVKVMNADGVWSNETALLTIKVLPPWYRTWWAYLLYLFTIGSAIYVYVLYNKRQERLRYEIKLAHLENEKEKEIAEKQVSFFTHISHEFRSPLTLIINPLKELISDENNAAIHKKIIMVHRNAKRLLSLVDQLLLFRKVESVDEHLLIEKFNITETCNEVFLSFAQHAASKNILFNFYKPDNKIFIYGDREKIEIILFNLLSNALKYTPPGGEISLKIIDAAEHIEISVKDSGTGIPADVGNKLFASFYQANNTGKASQTGFGIGLYVSQKLAIAHSGKISYTSQVGKGAEFVLKLLKGKEHFAKAIISEEQKTNQTILYELMEDPDEINMNETDRLKENDSKIIDKITSGLPTMVVVDDNAEMRHYLKEIFEKSFTVYEAGDGNAAYGIIVKENPDIVISDVMMKQMSGIELCKKIKENNSLAHIPVILLTANASEEAKLQGIESGAEDYINKPFDEKIIVAKVQNILKGRNRMQQYFLNSVISKPTSGFIADHKVFIENCIEIIERHLDNPDFTVQTFCREIGMSHPNLYKKVKAVSGLTVNVFVRYLRLRKAAELLINTHEAISEVALVTGFNDIKYFREQFSKLFGMNPSEFIKKYRKPLGNRL